MNPLKVLKKVLFWSYDRGSWQYDLLCVLILAFVFLGPNRLFHSPPSITDSEAYARPVLVARDEVAGLGEDRREARLSEYLTKKYGRPFVVRRIEAHADERGNIQGYLVWER